ncbi:MAG: NAD(P)-dependent oxidoreductase [Verrucomicrobiota bacterium]
MKISYLGLGIIGSIWVEHAQEDGHEIRSWNRTPKPDLPGFTSSISDAVAGAEIIHLCLADPPAVRSILEQILPSLAPGTMVIQSSTISPQASQEFEQMVTTAGYTYLEAPFTGSKPAAQKRDLVFFLGGEEALIDKALPYLRQLSRTHFTFSKCHLAAAIKLSMNLQIAAISQALTEGWHLAKHYGISHEAFYGVLRENVAHSPLAELKEPKLLKTDHSPQFSVKHMGKDLKLALDAGKDLNLSLTKQTQEIYEHGIKTGLSELDFIALEKLVRPDS